jgi:hypothetical protein
VAPICLAASGNLASCAGSSTLKSCWTSTAMIPAGPLKAARAAI